MYLLTTLDKPLVSETDIVCYKAAVTGLGGIPVTPLMGVKLIKNILNGRRQLRATGVINKTKVDSKEGEEPKYKIKGGVIHCYLSKTAFDKAVKANPGWFGYKVVIPAGTPYFTGEDGKIAAKAIRFVEKV